MYSASADTTFLLTDVEDASVLRARAPIVMQQAVAQFDALLKEVVHQHAGWVFKTVDDRRYASFRHPLHALNAAIAVQRQMQEEFAGGLRLSIRHALHSGPTELRNADYVGPTISRAVRLIEAGHGGQILLSEAVHDRLIDDLPARVALRNLGKRRLKDLLQPEHLYQVVTPDLQYDFPPLRTLDARPTNLPILSTPFVGRMQELRALAELIGKPNVRLVTLTGTAGIGKTRLALQMAAELMGDDPRRAGFGDGAFFVDLGAVDDPSLVAEAIACSLGLTERDEAERQVVCHLLEKSLLLILDGFDHLVDAKPIVAGLLSTCPGLTVVATARAPLGLEGERVFEVPALSVPEAASMADATMEELEAHDSIALFVQRAVMALPAFRLNRQNATDVVAICRGLGGLALAIELAAAHVGQFGPAELHGRVLARIRLPAGVSSDPPPRPDVLQVVLLWTLGLLREPERSIFLSCGILSGGASLAEIAAVALDPETDGFGAEDIDAAIDRLVKWNLLQRREEGAVASFSMLDPIRAFARAQLEASGTIDDVRHRRAAYLLTPPFPELREQGGANAALPEHS